MISGYSVSLQTCGDGSGGFNRLLIEPRRFTTLAVKTLLADQHKVAIGQAVLCFHQPVERIDSGGKHTFVSASRSC